METVITSGRHMMMERHWPGDGRGTQGRLQWRGEQMEVGVVRGRRVGKLLETVLPEMEKFQVRVCLRLTTIKCSVL